MLHLAPYDLLNKIQFTQSGLQCPSQFAPNLKLWLLPLLCLSLGLFPWN